MRTSIAGCASWNAATRVTSHFAASDAVVLTGQQAVAIRTPQSRGRAAQILEGRADRRQIVLRLAGQHQRAIAADEQPYAELVLEPADLMADRGLGDVELGGRTGEAQMPRCRVERAQSVERGQCHQQGSVGDMRLSHATLTKCPLSSEA